MIIIPLGDVANALRNIEIGPQSAFCNNTTLV